MIVRNEEALLGGCLAAACDHVDEIIVVDTGSTDQTIEIARAYGARVYQHAWFDDFAEARNVALAAATGEWIIVLDADDRLLPVGAHALKCAISVGTQMGRIHGYRLNIEERTLDGQALECALSSMRLFPNTPELRYVGNVHEEVHFLPNPAETTPAVISGGPHIAHYGSDPSFLSAKDERNLRLLTQRVEANPDDAYAWYYLARQHWCMDRPRPARRAAEYGLAHADALRPEHAEQLHHLLSDLVVVAP